MTVSDSETQTEGATALRPIPRADKTSLPGPAPVSQSAPAPVQPGEKQSLLTDADSSAQVQTQPFTNQTAEDAAPLTEAPTDNQSRLPKGEVEKIGSPREVGENNADEKDRIPTDQMRSAFQLQSSTPIWIDALAGLALAAITVFNGFSMALPLKLLALVLLVVAVVLQTKYSAAAQIRSNTFLCAALTGLICGFLIGGLVVLLSLKFVYPLPTWYPWVILFLSACLVYACVRGFRSYFLRVFAA